MRILKVYEAGSGQKLNLQKTSILFSHNTCNAKRQEFLRFQAFLRFNGLINILVCLHLLGKLKFSRLIVLKIGCSNDS